MDPNTEGEDADTYRTVHQALPLTFAAILIALVYRQEYNAATWSAIARHIQKSALPTLLRTDGGISFILSPSVYLICCLSIIVAVLVPVASFLTPIPLTDEVVASNGTKNVDFKYVPDTSFYGQGTPARPSDPIKRTCDHGQLYGDCPGSIYDDPTIRTEYPGHIMINSSIPEVTTQPYSSTSSPLTVASPLQIQYRNWYEGNYTYVDNSERRLLGSPRPLRSFVLDDGYQLVEGLVVDATNGGLGFRNHTIPANIKLGAEWDEDLLWVEPVTACTATNLSLHFSISINTVTSSADGYLSNDGGFSVLNQDPPSPRWDDDDDLQNNWHAIGYPPDLQNRADVAAWWNNQFVAQQLGIETSQIGDVYTDQLQSYAGLASPSSLSISDMDGEFLDNNFLASAQSNSVNFTAYGYRCSGYDDNNPSTPFKAYVRCGYLRSVPVPLDENAAYSLSRRSDLGSNWTQQVYTCASSTKASIKTVTFRFNGTEALEGLTVLDVKSKDYNNAPLPRWAVEHAWGYMVDDINPFWGITSDQVVNSSSVQVFEAPEIFLPATSRYIDYSKIFDSFAAGGAFGATWNSVYGFAAAVKGASLNFIPSYSGETNYAQTLKWRRLSQTAGGAANVLNLIWTDLAASAVVGTVTGFETQADQQPLQKRSSNPGVLGRRSVHPLIHKVGYSNLLYAIPAMILGGLFALAAAVVFIFSLFGRVSIRRLTYYTNQTSLGRAVAQMQHPEAADTDATSSEWKNTVGRMIIHVPRIPSRHFKWRKSGRSSQASLVSSGTGNHYAMSTLSAAGRTGYEPVQLRENDI